MRILTWNIQWGLGGDGRVDLERIAGEARRLGDPDVLCFQEVADGFAELRGSDGGDQFARLAMLFPQHEAVAGPNLDVRGPAGRRKRFGNMILSRFPVEQVIRHALPWTTAGGRECMPRGLLEAMVRSPLGPVRMMTTHLDYASPVLRRPQLEAIRAVHALACRRTALPPAPGKGTYAAQLASRSAVLTGDFNMVPEEGDFAILSGGGADEEPALVDAWRHLHPGVSHPPTMAVHDPAEGPPRCLDYVFATADLAPRLRAIRYDASSRASDHQPVVVELA